MGGPDLRWGHLIAQAGLSWLGAPVDAVPRLFSLHPHFPALGMLFPQQRPGVRAPGGRDLSSMAAVARVLPRGGSLMSKN